MDVVTVDQVGEASLVKLVGEVLVQVEFVGQVDDESLDDVVDLIDAMN